MHLAYFVCHNLSIYDELYLQSNLFQYSPKCGLIRKRFKPSFQLEASYTWPSLCVLYIFCDDNS